MASGGRSLHRLTEEQSASPSPKKRLSASSLLSLFKARQSPTSVSQITRSQALSPLKQAHEAMSNERDEAPIIPANNPVAPSGTSVASDVPTNGTAAAPGAPSAFQIEAHPFMAPPPSPHLQDEPLSESRDTPTMAHTEVSETAPLAKSGNNAQEAIDDDDDEVLSNINVASPPRLDPITPTRTLPPRQAKASYSNSPRPKPPKKTRSKTLKSKSKKQRAAENRIVDTDMFSEHETKSATRAPAIVKTDTIRNRVREEIATKTKAKRDAFLIHHRDYFLPLLPPSNYISKLHEPKNDFQDIVPHIQLDKQPEHVIATMKPYQLSGLSFMVNMFQNAMPAILGDEMGLGKTLQTLSLIQHLEENHPSTSELPRPYLVVCPLSVLGSWCDEARKWTPKLKVIRFHGTSAERDQLKSVATGKTDRFGNDLGWKKSRKKQASVPSTDGDASFDIMITTYEAFVSDQSWIKGAFVWRYCILDEGHKIKNDKTNISQALQGLQAEHRLLLTGTPLQNDMREMWALLHWLYPEVFTDKTSDRFKEAFDLGRGQVDSEFMDHARHLLELVMIRRMKTSPGVDLGLPPKEEVLLYVPLTPVQRFWYTRLLTKAGDSLLDDLFGNIKQKEHDSLVEDITEDARINEAEAAANADDEHEFTVQSRTIIQQAIANEATGETETFAYKKLMNLVMQLRKATIHPYMIKGAAPDPYELGDHILHASGKFIVLSKMIDELVVKQGKKVLIFSGFTLALDYCEDLLATKGSNSHDAPFRHVRFDGGTQRAVRNLQVRLFNDPSSEFKVMLISTRAGGLGLNLTAASDVIFLDEDWNPQVTLQAEARSHRIGQTNKVTIYKLCTQGTVEEQMMGRIRKKLYLSAKITESMQDIHSTPGLKRKRVSQEDDSSVPSDDGPELGVSQLKSLIRRGATTLTHPEININEMVGWSLDTIIEKCKDKPVDPHVGRSVDDVDEQEWLARMERVECAVLDGVKYQRKLDTEVTTAQDLRREDRRAGKNTTVMVDGYAINKESMSCGNWEAVPTFAGKDPRLASPKRIKAPPIGHQETCQICYDGGEIYLCSACPRTYHLDCLPDVYQAKAKAKMSFVCSQHNCIDCEKTTSNAGGLIYRCRWCHRGYCEDCLDPDSKLLGETLPEYEVLGFTAKRNAWYIHCQICQEAEGADPAVAEMVADQTRLFEKQYQEFVQRQKTAEDEAEDEVVITGATTAVSSNPSSRDDSMTDAVTINSSRQLTPAGNQEKSHRMVVVDLTEGGPFSHPLSVPEDVQAESGATVYEWSPKHKKRRTH